MQPTSSTWETIILPTLCKPFQAKSMKSVYNLRNLASGSILANHLYGLAACWKIMKSEMLRCRFDEFCTFSCSQQCLLATVESNCPTTAADLNLQLRIVICNCGFFLWDYFSMSVKIDFDLKDINILFIHWSWCG